MDIRQFFPWVIEHPSDAPHVQFIIVTVFAFLLVVAFAWKLIPGPMIRGILDERRTAIGHAVDQVESTLRETEQMRNDYRQRLEGIHHETERRLAEAVLEASSLREAILEDAQKASQSIVRRGQDEVERERAKVVQSMRTKFVEDAIHAAEYAAARSLDPSAQRRLLQEFVQNVGVKS